MKKEYAEYLVKKTQNDYDLISEEFSVTRQNPWPEIKFLFDDYIWRGDKVLDLGCGNGRFLKYFQGKDADYFGVDNSEKLTALAKQKYPQGRFQTAEALSLPFPDGFFDKIFSIAVLHHIPSQELRLRFLKESRRALRPGGLMVLTVWKFHKPESLLLIAKFNILKILGLSKLDFGDVLEPWSNKTKRYYHCFSKKALASLAEKAGFKIKKIGVSKNDRGNRQNIYLVAEK